MRFNGKAGRLCVELQQIALVHGANSVFCTSAFLILNVRSWIACSYTLSGVTVSLLIIQSLLLEFWFNFNVFNTLEVYARSFG